ncbi:MAG: hypothetical protein AUJ12_02815 [Alphaproteobacteria bacterium CG1_02_46_17]|nr:MAG: hypothetical protein AUJ12_02815 [Alphaproteobacteria bacterium CG1_02_46_17]
MEQRSAFLLQVLEKLAAPLVAAISEVSVRQQMSPDPAQPSSMKPEAEQVAGLLTKSTQMSISLSDFVDMKLPENEADSLRLALTSLASPLIANIYRLAGRAPTDAEIERVTSALNAVISYADGFAPAADATTRMTNLENDFAPTDASQVSILYISALLPAINSVMSYSFGVPEKRLVQDVGERLVREAKVLRTCMFPSMSDDMMMAKADLALLRIVASIYSQCHFAEMAKLMATEEQSRQGMAPAMTSLWQAFILRVQMIEVLGSILIPGVADEEKAGTARSGGGGKSPGVAALKTTPESLEKPTNPFRDKNLSDKAAEGAGGKTGPMSFFVKKNSA